MTRAWELIFAWRYAQEQALNCEQEAKEARARAAEVEARFKAVLKKHGPLRNNDEIFRLSTNDEIICEPFRDAFTLQLEEHA